MIITTIRNNKLFIQFDRLVKNGLIQINGENGFETQRQFKDSEFEVFELPYNIKTIHLNIAIDDEKSIIKSLNI
ncbi:MAG: hypothetical protein B6D61_06680 [Bacteroidetes bacterium 4484_249]|nr:MAG: hypothetical protein B6D61_06680 [Bacteroidetes bacterium 4484_249]